jgi:hypothetical protein
VLGRLATRAIASSRVPFDVKQRLQWRREEGRWRAPRPRSFTGKVRWKMLHDRRPLLTTFADKAAARDYVASAAGPQYLAESHGLFTDGGEFRRAHLPREFVAKVTHGCGGTLIVSEEVPAGGRVVWGERHVPGPKSLTSGWHRVFRHPDELQWGATVAMFREWLSWNYAERSLEWAYLDVPPRILVEELLRGPAPGASPADYKVFVFNGQPRLVQVDTGRHTDHRRDLFTPGWSHVPAEYLYPRSDEAPVRPPNLDEMLDVAEALGRETDFVRVDLYDVDGRVVFGELTNYPEAGTGSFTPAEFDDELGAWWHLPDSYL